MEDVIIIHGHDYGNGKPELNVHNLLKCSFEDQLCRRRFAEEVGRSIRDPAEGWEWGTINYFEAWRVSDVLPKTGEVRCWYFSSFGT